MTLDLDGSAAEPDLSTVGGLLQPGYRAGQAPAKADRKLPPEVLTRKEART